MKKKVLSIITIVALTATLTACGGTTDTVTETNSNEMVVESQSELEESSDVPAESQEEVIEPTEIPDAEEAPVAETKPYTLSEVTYPNGETSAEVIFDDFLNNGAYNNPEVIQPYYTLTNTSDSAYGVEIDNNITNYTDLYFEPGESIVVPAFLYPGDATLYGEEGLAYWLNADDSSTLLQYGDGVEIKDTNPARNTVQEMITITFDESKVLYENVLSVDIELPENADTNETPIFFVIYYDAEGNVISSGTSNDFNGISFADKTFTYPAMYYTTTNEPFVWATADVYYSYTLAQ